MYEINLDAVTRPDGTVSLTVPTGQPAGVQVHIEVRIDPVSETGSRKDWEAWVAKMSGCISDPAFERPEQPPLDEVEPL